MSARNVSPLSFTSCLTAYILYSVRLPALTLKSAQLMRKRFKRAQCDCLAAIAKELRNRIWTEDFPERKIIVRVKNDDRFSSR